MIDETNDTEDVSRRRVLKQTAALGVAGTSAALAGCSGGNAATAVSCASEQATLSAPSIGPDSAPSVEIFVDWSCPHCRDYHEESTPALKEAARDGQIQLVHRDFPLPVNDWSKPVAYLARAVQEQVGVDAFWDFADEAFANQKSYSQDTLTRIATGVGLSQSAVQQQLEETNYCQAVQADKQRGQDVGIDATPKVYANETVYPGMPADQLLEEIQTE